MKLKYFSFVLVILLFFLCGSVSATDIMDSEVSVVNDESTLSNIDNNFLMEDNDLDFSANVTEIPDNGYIQFTAPSGYDTYEWCFDNSNKSSEQNPIYYYDSIGSYSVSLTVINGSSNISIVKNNFINIFSSRDANVFFNPGFEDGLENWIYDSGGTVRSDGYEGNAFVMGAGKAYNFGQYINLTNVKTIEFYYKITEPYGAVATRNLIIEIDGVRANTPLPDSHKLKVGSDWVKLSIDATSFVGYSNYQDGNLHKINFRITTLATMSAYFDSFSAYVSEGNNPMYTYTFINSDDEMPKVQFNDTSKGFITGWLWDFGDNTTSNEQNPVHEWTEGGVYTVTLTTFSRDTNSSYCIENLVVIGGPKNNNTNISYQTIQDAIYESDENSIIIVGEGTTFANENLVIDKNLTFIGLNEFILKASDNSKPLITVNSGNVIFDGFKFIDSSNAILVNNGTITITNSTFSNNNNSIILANGSLSVKNSNFTSNNVAITQNDGNLTLVGNVIASNNVGVKVISGNATINFNNFMNNANYSLMFNSTNIDASNNWWNTNNPVFVTNSNITSKADIYYTNKIGISSGLKSANIYQLSTESLLNVYSPFIILNVTSNKSILAGGKSTIIIVDFTKNSNGEEVNKDNLVPGVVFSFDSTLGTYNIVENNTNYFKINFTAGNVDGTATFTANANDGSEIIIFTVDNTAPIITYITPATTFSDNIEITIACDDSTATIYYTVDGTNPVNSSTRLTYNNPFTLSESTTVHVTAIDDAGNYARANYTWFYSGEVNPNDHSYNFRTQYYDLAVTYLKEITLNNSGAIWNQYQGNRNNSGVTLYNGSLTNTTSWFIDYIASSSSAVVDKDGHIYIAGSDGILYCLNNQGKTIWSYATSSGISCTPTIGSDGNIYFTNDENSSLYVISPEGQLVFKYNLGENSIGASPVFGPDGTLYVLNGNTNISTLFAFKDNILIWNCSLPEIMSSTPAIGEDGTLYLMLANQSVIAINWDGTIKYSFYLSYRQGRYDASFLNQYGDDIKTSHISISIGSDGIFYVLEQPHYIDGIWGASVNYPFRAYYPNGSIKWYGGSYASNILLSGSPTYYDGVLYITSSNRLFALNASNGVTLWSSPIASASYSLSSPLVSGDKIIYVTSSNMVYAFDTGGNQIWSYTLTGKYGDPVSFASPVLSDDGTLIITTNQGIFTFNDISADFSYEHVNGTRRTIQFTDLSTSGDNEYYWDFGDNSTISNEQNPKHFYDRDGKYNVVLIIRHDGRINLARNMTIEVESWDITPPSRVTPTIDGELTHGGLYSSSQTVVLTASDDSGIVTIYYTVDGSNPINSSTRRVYVEPITVDAYTVLSYVAVDPSNNWGKTGSITINITDAVFVEGLVVNSTNVSEVQKLFDEAEAGSKFVFTKDIKNANFVINKAINIITNINTEFSGNGVDPVFTVNSANATINGFTIKNTNGNGILINTTDNVTVINCKIYANETGIMIFNSTNITVKDTTVSSAVNGIIVNQSEDTLLERVNVEESYDNGLWVLDSTGTDVVKSVFNNNGKDWYNSKANNILLDGSVNTNLLNNSINYGFFGIHLTNTNRNLFMDYNLVYEGTGDAILLEGKSYNVNITHNTLDGSFNGINFNGYYDGVNVENNLIQKMHYHSGEPDYADDYKKVYVYGWSNDVYGQYNNAIEVSGSSSNFHNGVRIINNICILTQHRAWEARHTYDYVQAGCDGYGYNLFDGSNAYNGDTGGATSYNPGRVDLVLDRIGDTTYRLRLINRLTNEYIDDVPDFDVKFTAGGFTQVVKFHEGAAIATFDVTSTITNVKAQISSYIYTSISWDTPISDGYNSTIGKTTEGYTPGDAINNQNPVIEIPTTDTPTYGGDHNGDGQGTGIGPGTGGGSDDTGTAGSSDVLNPGSEADGDINYIIPSVNNPTSSDSTTETVISIPNYDSELINNNNNNQNSEENTNTNTNTDSNLVKTDDGTADAPSSSSQATAGTTSTEAIAQAIASLSSSSSEASEGSDDSSEGGASVGDSSKAYEIEKSINKNLDNGIGYIISGIILIGAVGLGTFGYRRRRGGLE